MSDRASGNQNVSAPYGFGSTDESTDAYDHLVRLARRAFGVETAIIEVMDRGRPRRVSLAGKEVPKGRAETAFCLHVLRESAPLIVPDARADARFASHPAVSGPPHMRFIAGAPIVATDGSRLGALLLLDPAPPALTADDVAMLGELAHLVAERADRQRRAGTSTPSPRHPSELAASISDNISEGIFRSVPGRGLVYVNQACVDLFGYDTQHDLLRVDTSVLYADPDQRDAVIARLDQEGMFRGMVVRLRRRNGSVFWGLMSARASYDEAGRVQYRDGSVVDITQRKRMERELRASEERWQRLVANHPDAVFINVDGRFRYANPAGAQLLGVAAPGDLIGRSVFEFLADDIVPAIRARQAVLEHGASTAPIEHAIVRTDGRQRVIEVNSVPISYGGEAAVQTVARDVTDRRRAEQQLRAAEAKFRGLVERSLAGIYIIQDYKFSYANPALAKTLGYSADALMERVTVQDMVHEDDWPLVRRNLQKRIRGDIQGVAYSFRIRRPDGAVRSVEVHGARTEHQGAPAVIGTLLDITEQKEWEQNLVAAKEKAEEMNRLKSAFLANMSHEIRTPLTSIIGFADLIGSSPESAGEFAGLIQQSGQRLLWTLNSVLDLAQLEAGALSLHTESVDFAREVREVLDQFRPQAYRKDIALELDVPAEPVRGAVDRIAFSRVLTNLVANAVKFTHDGHVTVALQPGERTVEVRVTDTGIGIGEDFLERIFDEFRQESSGEARTHEGSGLGLAIVQRLVELMGGTIGVDSTLGVGSTFTVRLPRLLGKERERKTENG
jgi:PAS domain S-box-containing protein